MHSKSVSTAIIAVCALLSATRAAKLPKYFGQCSKTDSQLDTCLKQKADAGLADFLKGDPEHHVAKMLPLHVPQMQINVNGNLDIKMKDCDIFGLDTIDIQKINWNFDKKRFELQVKIDRLNIIGMYDIKGKILILPITGNGPCNITYVHPVYQYHFEYELQEKDGKQYVNIVRNGNTYTMDHAHFQFDNLFNGDKRLGDEMSKFLNENWKEVDGEVGVKVGEAMGQVISAVLQEFFSVVPMNELFA